MCFVRILTFSLYEVNGDEHENVFHGDILELFSDIENKNKRKHTHMRLATASMLDCSNISLK